MKPNCGTCKAIKTKEENSMEWFFKRLMEGSTWAAISAATGTVGVYLNSGESVAAAIGAAVLGFVVKDKVKK